MHDPNPTEPQPDTAEAHTVAVRRILALPLAPSAIADLLFWEAWERDPVPGPACVLRVSQLRRAHPMLAAAIRRELGRSGGAHQLSP